MIGENEPVLIDFAGVFNGYIIDMTRMFVIGSLDPVTMQQVDQSLRRWLAL